ncbi:hypothetical protein R8Z50_31140 [Longispora sp. K20-0274]|uniref:hypothetical protein n=1 Tax=Longispora sp. K20-0274 TaxID=3088255 RepID=UPI0039997D1C
MTDQHPRRGEIWRYQPAINRPGICTTYLIVSADVFNTGDGPTEILAVQVVDTDPGSLVSPYVREHGWARTLTIAPIMRSRLVEMLDVADHDTIEAVDVAMRAVLNL